MNTTDERNLEACVLTLSRWKGQLPTELHSQIQAAGRQLAKDESAINDIRNLLKQHGDLSSAYEDSRRELYQRYNARERSKGAATTFINGTVNSGNLIVNMAVPILTADNFSSTAQQLVAQPSWRSQVKNASDDVQTFFKTLEESVTQLDAISIQLMKWLDKEIYTIDELAYRTEKPKARLAERLEALWQENYIYTVSGSALSNFFESLNVFSKRKGKLDLDSYLALSAKGYFYLHPYFKATADSSR
ncbi:MAG: hypothetical protein AAF716_16840 [Cyanobacteria bacterium P01_D01_bin.1]